VRDIEQRPRRQVAKLKYRPADWGGWVLSECQRPPPEFLSGHVTSFTSAVRGPGYQCQSGWRSQMAAIARVLSRAFPSANIEVETLKIIALFCGVGLLVSLLLTTMGLDISAGFF
jgi:hypothetical protein